MNDFANRTQIQIDVAVLAPQEPGRPRRILSLGEAKWGEVSVLACYSATGFHDDLRTAQDPRLALITLDDIYA